MTDEEKQAAEAEAKVVKAAEAAAAKAKANTEKELLKSLGVDSVDSLRKVLADAKAVQDANLSEVEKLKNAHKEVSGQLTTTAAERDEYATKYKTLSLERVAETVGATQGVSPAKAKQILKLLDVSAAEFDPEKNDLEDRFKAFLAEPENKHFIGETVSTSGGGSRTPQNSTSKPVGSAGDDKITKLRSRLTGTTGLR